MSKVILPKSLWNGSVPLPKVCIACGKPATSRAVIKTQLESSPTSSSSNDTSALGCLFSVLDTLLFLRNVAARESRLRLYVPVCRYHAWVVPPNVTIESVNDQTVELTGVSPEFIALLPKHDD